MPASVVSAKDDRLTMIGISTLACILQDVLHEGLGHGVTAWLSGAHRVTMSTVALQSDIDTRLISANGTIVNLLFAAIFWLLLLRPQRYRPATRYFLVLAMTGNLFTGTGYFLFSGVFNFGDRAAVIRGLQPHWMWQLGLVVLGVTSYYASMLVVAAKLKPFQGKDGSPRRLRQLCWTPYFTEGILAGLGGGVKALRTILCHSVRVAFYFGRKCWPAELAWHDAQMEPKRRGSWSNASQRCVDRYCRRR